MNLSKVVKQLAKERARLTNELHKITAALTAFGKVYRNGTRPKTTRRRSKISAAGRKRIAAAQRARWAKIKAKKKAA